MCESSAFVEKGDGKELLMKDVVKAVTGSGNVTLVNILGEEMVVEGSLREVNLLAHTLTIGKA